MLEQGYVPKGISSSPRSGHHRQFGPGEAFWLSMVLKLKENGMPVPMSADVANFAERALQMVTHSLNWDWKFAPRKGQFDTQRQYFVDVGDRAYVRFVCNANPSLGGELECLEWHRVIDWNQVKGDFAPYLVLRLDLTLIARRLADHFSGDVHSFDEPLE